MIMSEGDRNVMSNMQRKADRANAMFSNLVVEMNHGETVKVDRGYNNEEKVPAWL